MAGGPSGPYRPRTRSTAINAARGRFNYEGPNARPMISASEMRVLDRNALHFGVSILELMENAGKAVADVARKEFGASGRRVLVVAGTGNNGGDGVGAGGGPPHGAPPGGRP